MVAQHSRSIPSTNLPSRRHSASSVQVHSVTSLFPTTRTTVTYATILPANNTKQNTVRRRATTNSEKTTSKKPSRPPPLVIHYLLTTPSVEPTPAHRERPDAEQPKRSRPLRQQQVTFQLMPSGTLPYPAPNCEQTQTKHSFRACRNLLSHKIVLPTMEQSDKAILSAPKPAAMKNYHFLMDNHQSHEKSRDYTRQQLEAEQFQRSNAVRNHSRASRGTPVKRNGQAAHTGCYSTTTTSASAVAAESADEESPPSSLVRSDMDYGKNIPAYNSPYHDAASATTPSALSNSRRNHQQYSQKTPSTTTANTIDRSPVISVDDASTSRGYYSDAPPPPNGINDCIKRDRKSEQATDNQRQHQYTSAASAARSRTNNNTNCYVSSVGHQQATHRESGAADRHPQPPQQHYYYTTPTTATPSTNSNHHAQQQHQLSQYCLPPQYYHQQHPSTFRPVYATLPTRLPSGSPIVSGQQCLTYDEFIGSNGPLTAAPSYMTLVQLVPTNSVNGRPMIVEQLRPPVGRNGRPMTVRELKKLRNKQKKGGHNKELYSTASFRSDWPLPSAATLVDPSPYLVYDYNTQQQSAPWAYATMPRANPVVFAAAQHHQQQAVMAAASAASGTAQPVHPPPPHVVKPARLDSAYEIRQFHPANSTGVFMSNPTSVFKSVDFKARRPSFCRRICCTGYALVAWLIALVVLIGITVTIMLLILFR